MSFPSKRIEQPWFSGNECGSALIVVIAFTVIAMISAFSYLLHQMSLTKPALGSPSSLQALFNARSGIYRALYELIDSTQSDTVRTISTLDSTFGSSMFLGVPDTSPQLSERVQLDGLPVVYELFPENGLGECEVSAEPAGGCCLLQAVGTFRSVKRRVTATLGSRCPALPDTVAVYHNTLPWSTKPSRGTVAAVTDTMRVNFSWLGKLINRYQTDISETDTFLLNPPLLIDTKSDFAKIDSVVNSALLIDGAHIGLTWKSDRRIIVKGDLQITGEVLIEGIDFVVVGEIKLLDNTKLLKSNLFTQSRLFIGDFARFEGNALALHSIAVYGKAEITGRSTIITSSTGSSSSKSTLSDSLKFSILLSEEATIDAVCLALGTPGSIKTDPQTRITGILWAQHLVCHRGKMAGLICAGRLVDCDNPLEMETSPSEPLEGTGGYSALAKTQLHNSIPGDLAPLQEIGLYHLPYFVGRLSIVAWKEG